MTTRIRFADMDFISEDMDRDDSEILFIGYLYDSMLTSKYFMDLSLPDIEDFAIYQAHMTLLKSYLTHEEYSAMIVHIDNTVEE